MKTITFKYEKEPGQVTNRVLIPLVEPSHKYFGVDVTELDIEDQVAFERYVEEAHEEFKDKIAKLMQEYDIKHNYRFFKPEKMFDIVEE